MLSNSLRADLIMRSLANQAAKLQRCFVKSPIYIRGLTETPVFILCQVPKHEKLVFYPNAEPFFFFVSRVRTATDCRLPIKIRGLLNLF